MSTLNGTWNYPTSVRFGAGRISELPDALHELGIRKPLLVTDRGLVDLPPVREALSHLAGIEHGVYSDVAGNPTGEHVIGGVKVMREGGYDGVIALGGGSALDVGKAVALMWRQTRPLWDYQDHASWWKRIDPAGMAPVVAVPTTSGTGSEVGRASVIIDPTNHTKKILFHPNMLPGKVIADPALTTGLPAGLTAATGIDAMSHALEAWCSPAFHPMADGIAAEAIRMVDQSLLAAVHDGSDLDARARMMAASMMGATAFQKGLGAMHSMAHVIGARLDAHHGLLNAIVMPYVLRHNLSAIDDKLGHLARSMGLAPTPAAFIDRVLELREATRTPHTLAAVGLEPAHIATFAAAAVNDPSTPTNPLPMDAAAFEQLFEAALHGNL